MNMQPKQLLLGGAALAVLSLVPLRFPRAGAQVGLPVSPFHEVPYQGQNVNAFQMFYSAIMRADTFLVDTSHGMVWVLTEDAQGTQAFVKAAVKPTPPAGGLAGRYRIFYSGVNRKDTFLVDTTTGKMWVMTVTNNQTAFQGITVEGVP